MPTSQQSNLWYMESTPQAIGLFSQIRKIIMYLVLRYRCQKIIASPHLLNDTIYERVALNW